ncbi:MAG: hypothetical protein AAF939_20120 [Planctomycetota bacterium]
MSRRQELEAMLAETPNDIFLKYALALELANEEEHEQSLEIHHELMEKDPPYVPSFFMSAQQLVDIDREDEAIAILEKGINQAEQQNDLHAAAEMRAFMESI